MIQFNLLPSVKKEYIKAKRTKRLITTVSLVAMGASIGIVVILLSIVQFGQKKHITDLSNDIEQQIATIGQIEDLDSVLTIQNQLNSLESLHQQKPEASRLFDFFGQLTPEGATISNLTVDFIEQKMTISGTAKDIVTVNKFADTLKFAEYTQQLRSEVTTTTDENGEEVQQEPSQELESMPVFSSVLTQVSRSEQDTNFILETIIDVRVFDNTLAVALSLPGSATTRSEVNRPGGPSEVFEESTIPAGSPGAEN